MGMMEFGEVIVQPKADPSPMALFDRAAQLLDDGFDGLRRDVSADGVGEQGMQNFSVFVIHNGPSRSGLGYRYRNFAQAARRRIDLAQHGARKQLRSPAVGPM